MWARSRLQWQWGGCTVFLDDDNDDDDAGDTDFVVMLPAVVDLDAMSEPIATTEIDPDSSEWEGGECESLSGDFWDGFC